MSLKKTKNILFYLYKNKTEQQQKKKQFTLCLNMRIMYSCFVVLIHTYKT